MVPCSTESAVACPTLVVAAASELNPIVNVDAYLPLHGSERPSAPPELPFIHPRTALHGCTWLLPSPRADLRPSGRRACNPTRGPDGSAAPQRRQSTGSRD